MKKILLFTIITFGFLLSINFYASSNNKLYIHYFRSDQNYSNYTLWIWEYEPTNKGGVEYTFLSEDSFGGLLVLDIETTLHNSTKIGIIIKQGSGWSGEREPGGDRYIDLTLLENSEVHAYFISGSAGISYSDKGIASASFLSNGNISVVLFKEALTYKLYKGDNVIKQGNALSTFIITGVTVDLSDIYTIEIEYPNNIKYSKVISVSSLYDTEQFKQNYTYDGPLGVIYTKEKTIFRLWAPISEEVVVNIYDYNHPYYDNSGNKRNTKDSPIMQEELRRIENGAWETTIDSNLEGKYYTFSVTNAGIVNEVVDPYAYSVGANGLRGLIVDFSKTNPTNWVYNKLPKTITNFTDYIIYELHVRDLTSSITWTGKEKSRGKFLGLAESGTTYSNGVKTVKTGLDHLIELGINAVQLLPIFDSGIVDETKLDDPNYNKFNWGYMPLNYNSLEGSYSTNPFDGYSRIIEFKEAVQALSAANIRVIMDVVYNHTGTTNDSNLNLIVPDYYYRTDSNGAFLNGSGTGNETASDRAMFSKLMVDSTSFFAKEYNLSGFRFDLMGLHDIETMNNIRKEMDKIDPTIAIYGEPWDLGALDDNDAANFKNITKLNNVGAFNDTVRDAIRGGNDNSTKGFVQGNLQSINNVRTGIVGGIDYKDIVDSSKGFNWIGNPNQNILYISAHDNLTLRDKLYISSTGVSQQVLQNMQKQALAIIMTSEGIPFLHAGSDFMRSKPANTSSNLDEVIQGYDRNTYDRNDSINQLKYDEKIKYYETFEYIKGLIEIRKTYQEFRLNNSDDINNKLSFFDDNSYIGYKITSDSNEIVVIHNPNTSTKQITLQEGIEYNVLSTTLKAGNTVQTKVSGKINVSPSTTIILVKNYLNTPSYPPYTPETDTKEDNKKGCKNTLAFISIVPMILGSLILIKKKKD